MNLPGALTAEQVRLGRPPDAQAHENGDNRCLPQRLDSGALAPPHVLLPAENEGSDPRLVLHRRHSDTEQLTTDLVDSADAFDAEIEFLRR